MKRLAAALCAAQRVEELDTLQKGQQARTAAPNASISPFGNPFDKILRQTAHSEQSSSHTICRKISLSVSPSSAHVRRRRQFLTVCAALCAAVLALSLSGCSGGASERVPDRPAVQSGERQFTAPADGDLIAIFDTSLGEVRAVLYPDAAPMAVQNFVGLARNGYYDGTIIWRSEYGFAVQGGDATGTGTGGSTIWSNHAYPLETDASLKHYAGALCAAFASGGEEEGGNSQFYFVTALPDSVDKTMQEELAANGYTEAQIAAYADAGGLPYLDNTDTVFGQVYAGMEVVDAMACVDTVQTEDGADTHRPTEEATITINTVTIATYPGPATAETAEGE